MAKTVKPFGSQVSRVAGKAFKCECGCRVLEEVMGGVTYSSIIKSVRDEEGFGMAEYGKTSADGGEVESIQCASCGKHVCNSHEQLLRIARTGNEFFVEAKTIRKRWSRAKYDAEVEEDRDRKRGLHGPEYPGEKF